MLFNFLVKSPVGNPSVMGLIYTLTNIAIIQWFKKIYILYFFRCSLLITNLPTGLLHQINVYSTLVQPYFHFKWRGIQRWFNHCVTSGYYHNDSVFIGLIYSSCLKKKYVGCHGYRESRGIFTCWLFKLLWYCILLPGYNTFWLSADEDILFLLQTDIL